MPRAPSSTRNLARGVVIDTGLAPYSSFTVTTQKSPHLQKSYCAERAVILHNTVTTHYENGTQISTHPQGRINL